MNIADFLFSLAGTVGELVLFAAILLFVYLSGMVRYISNDKVGVVEKIWSLKGSVKNGFIALNGEAGYQPEILRGGFQFFWPFMYRVHKTALVTIPQGGIGYVFARDGVALDPTQTLASNKEASNFEDVRDFLAKGGQKGPQRKILREGTYAINLAQFVVFTADKTHMIRMNAADEELFEKMHRLISERTGYAPIVIRDKEDMIGVVTVHDGPSLPVGEIIGPTVGSDATDPNFHNNFQDPEKFLSAGGNRGRQLQVLADGSYFINRLFATVELIAKTTIEIGTVGVVVSYVGREGQDVSGEAFQHGSLVEAGFRGVQKQPLSPGKYAFNRYAASMSLVPTTNFILKWTNTDQSQHRLDENLSEISAITKDAFEILMPLSVVMHIDHSKASEVIQRFGDVKRLVEQTLDPMVAAYFKNVAQTKTLIELLQERSDIEKVATEEMHVKFREYSLELKSVLIGTPRARNGDTAFESLLEQLRMRQVAEEKKATYQSQGQAAVAERDLRQKQAEAEQQSKITESLLQIDVADNLAKAALARARQEAEAAMVTADAKAKVAEAEGKGEAARIRQIGDAEASKIGAIGKATAEAIEAKVAAFGNPELLVRNDVMTRFAEAAENGQLQLVPKIQIGGGIGGAEGSATSGLVSLLLSTMVDKKLENTDETKKEEPAQPVVQAAE